MAQLFANNATSVLASSISNSATTIALKAGDGAKFPSLAGTDFFMLTLIGRDANGNENSWEIVKVTARSADSLTCVRGQDSTTAVGWGTATPVALRTTAGTLNGLAPKDSPTFTTQVTLPAGTTSKAGILLVAGSLLTTPLASAVEWDGTNLYVTNSAAARKTIAYLDSSVTGTATNVTGVVAAANGGTGLSSYTIGDILYASGATTLSKLTGVVTGNVLLSGGAATAPFWGKVNLTTHITGTLGGASGGTGFASYAVGDMLYASGTTNLSTLAAAATGNALISSGTGTAPAWGKIGLTTHVTGTLPIANGGTNATSASVALSNLGGVSTSTTIFSGNGMTGGGALSANVTLTLGTPSTISSSTSNSVSASSHTHALVVTQSDVGLSNVNNTSDSAKPVSTAQQAAIDAVRPVLGTSVSGLVGGNNAASPNTKLNLSANTVTLRNSSGFIVTQYNTGTLTCDLGLAGPAANGRDQAAAFSTGTWVHFYFIWNGTTIATLVSTTSPESFTGSTLPTGYTYWAYATTIRWTATSTLRPSIIRGCHVENDNGDDQYRVVTSGVATTFTALSCVAFVPPNALMTKLHFGIAANHTAGGAIYVLVRPTGSASTGQGALKVFTTPSAWFENCQWVDMALGTSQSLDYKLTVAPNNGGGFTVGLLGFTVPNGDS